jgi:hypothetical protein
MNFETLSLLLCISSHNTSCQSHNTLRKIENSSLEKMIANNLKTLKLEVHSTPRILSDLISTTYKKAHQ